MKDSISLLSDEPVLKDEKLGIDEYAKVLEACIKGTRGPFTIGVFGKWGVGKTSLLRMVEASFRGKEGYTTVWFDPWKYEREMDPIVPFFTEILTQIRQDEEINPRIWKSLKVTLTSLLYATTLNLKGAIGFTVALTLAGSAFSLLNIHLLDNFFLVLPYLVSFIFLMVLILVLKEVGLEVKGKDFVERRTELAKTMSEDSLYYEAYQRLTKNIPQYKKVVVFIDDLDRCFPDKAIKLLETIKLALTSYNMIFLLSISREVIDDFITEKYRKQGIKSSDFDATNYLDKIIQLPFPIPPHDLKIEKYIRTVIWKLPHEKRLVFDKLVPVIK